MNKLEKTEQYKYIIKGDKFKKMMSKHLFCVVFVLVYGGFVRFMEGACVWPSSLASTSWKDNSKGNITFTTDKLTGWGITISGAMPPQYYSSWQCYSNSLFVSDNIIIAITQSSVTLFNQPFYGYICLKLRAITSFSYRYYVYSPNNNNVDKERVQMKTNNNETDLQSLCLLTTSFSSLRPASSEYRVMIKTGSGAAVKIDCPYVFLGSYGYTHTSKVAVTCDTSTSTWSTCQDSTEMMFNYSTCPTKVAYSKSNAVWCVDTVPSGGNNYVTVYNGYDQSSDIDGVNIFLFACFAISSDGTMASVVPTECKKDQVPDTAPNNVTGAATLTMIRDSKTCLTCPAAVAPTSGSVSYSTDGATTNASYTCSSTYSLAGPSTRSCQSNRTWAGENPTCTCALPASPANGSLSVSTDGTLTYSCNIGFVLNGSRTRVCQNSSNTWSGVQPTCDLCDTINTTTGLVTISSSTGITTVAAFTCKAGYTLNGNTSATCLVSKQWNATAPLCVVCANFSSSSTLNITLGTDGYTSSATFTCVPGYHVVGSSSATCSKTGVWSSISTCECDAQSQPANGSRTGNGSISEFTCQAGYTLIGSSSSVCKADGTGWSSSTPTCYGCNNLNNTSNGYYNLATNGLVTVATFSCLSGYTMSGTRTRYCQTNGSWNGTNPTCVKCGDLVNPSSGNFTMWTDGTVSQAYYACAAGYNISGSTNSTCKTDGTWTNAAPTCFCSPASKPANGAILSDNGQVVYYKCNLNYSMSGSSVRSCSTNGTGWSGSDPSCVMCGALRAVPGGNVSLTTDDVNTKAAYTCDVGYTISGNKLITCQSDGTWDSAQSNCTKCSNLTTPVGGNYTLQSVDSTVTKATFICAVGYTLKLYSVLTCKDTGAWDNNAPECVLCPNRVSPNSGNLTLQTDGLTTTGTYQCATGYTLVGQSTITCRTTGFWNYPEATCTCNNPANLGNGSVIADGLTVTYTCNTGFTLSGSSSGTCKTDGTGWSISTPTCVACESLANFTSGNVTYTSNGSTTVVQYTCLTGASLQGAATATCNATGKWGTSLPTCVSCPSLPSVSVTTGSVSLTTNGTTTQAHYTCPSGYQVKGSTLLTCNSNGTWSNNASDCVCTTPSAPAGGNFTVSSDGRSIVFACGEGYTMAGVPKGTCATDGSGWNISYPTCTKCNSLTTPSNGTVTLVTTGTQTTALFKCGLGYTLSGTAAPVCQSDGTWSSSVTNQTCVSCPSLPNVTITNGYVSMTTNGTTTTAIYNCPPGYEVKGNGMLTCRTDSTWSSTPSTCVCGKPSIPTGGNYTLSGDGLTVTFTCKAGYTISGAQVISCATDGSGWKLSFPNCSRCDNLTLPTGGNVSLVTNGTQTLAVYTCNVGSSLNGVARPTCLDNGTWASAQPTCVTCPTLPAVSVTTGFINLVTDGSTTTAVYNCPAGYEVKGTQNITCGTNGTWSASPSDCVCKTPSNPAGGNYSLSTDGLTVTFACGTGYTMVGTQNSSCNTDGSGWNLTQPTCTKCNSLTTPSNGTVTLVTTGIQTTALFTCGLGYTLSGTAAPVCQSDGTWSSSVTNQTCVSCPSLPNVTIPNGYVSMTTNGTTTTAIYNCPPGYEVKGNGTLTCRTDSTWSSTPSTCVCGKPSVPTGGNYTLSDDGLTVTFMCKAGYTISGAQVISCATDGSGWKLSFPNCSRCDNLTLPSGGNLSLVTNGTQTLAVYTCNVGSSLNGVATPTCLDNGTWTSARPTCVTCPALPSVSVTTGFINLVTDGSITTAVYNCPAGYEVKGTQNITCRTNGSWSASPSDCVCKTPSNPAGGNYSLSTDGLTVTFACGTGYTMVGTQNISCNTDGSGWNLSQPTCTKCDNLTTPTGGAVTLTTTGTQTTAVYTCGVGYSLSGQSAPKCQTNGSWTAAQPTCVSCPSAVNITNGKLNVTTDGLITRAVYTCSSGYVMEGNPILTCLTNGSWNSLPPICYCTAPSAPIFGSVSANKTTAVYTCDQGFILKGTAIRTCQDNGLGWTGSAPTCTVCDTLTAPQNGSLEFSSNGTVTTVTFSCALGFSMAGTRTLICLNDGSWSGNAPTCVQCPALSQPYSGSLVISSNNVTTSANYSCVTGYYIVGETHLNCSSTGKWSADSPFCACNNVTASANGGVNISVVQGLAQYTCKLGYSINGVATRSCATDGSGWNGSQPSCVGCPTVTATTDGNSLLVSDGTVTSVNFQCDVGATIKGPSALTCQSDGTWTSVQPTCVSCPSLTDPNSGSLNISTDGHTSTASYTCANGYDVVGTATRQCQTDGTWSGTGNTSCVCTTPSQLVNGTMSLQNGGLRVSYTCDVYFTLKGDRERTCPTDGSGWTGSEPTCVLYNKPSIPANGNVNITSNGTHTIATYTCNLNYTLKGQSVAVWLPEGRWSSSEPSCVKCSTLTNLASGTIVLSTNGTITMATFTCPNNYYISGNREISCQENQKWSGTVPECLCNDPSSIANGKLTSDGMTASFQCDVGYSLQGSSGLHCGDNGTGWNSAVPKCNLCTTLTTPNSGNKSITTNGINTMATFQCGLGTTLNGSNTLKCYVDGSWDGSVPNCVTCAAITPPASGQYIMSSDGVTTSVQLKCDDGYEAAGQTSVQCGTDGTWKLTQQSTCNEKKAEGAEAGSLLGALIAVVVVSIIIIAVLSILLARFVYLYLQRRKGGEYLSDYDTDKPTSNEYDKFPVPMVKLTSSAAPVNHQRHVMERGVSFAASPAPHGFEKHVIGNGEVPMSPPPVETHRSGTSIISFRRSASNMTEKSVNSISAINIKDTTSYADTSPRQHVTKSSKSNGVVKHNDKKALLPSPKSNRLAPIANHQQLVGKLGQNPQIKTLQVEGGESGSGRCSPEIRSSTPTMMKHALTVTSYDSKSLDSVSIVEN